MKGFSLIEVVVYMAILSLLTVVAVNTILTVNSYLAVIRTTRLLSDTETLAMERIVRVIRDAAAVDEAASTFDASPGVLSLTGSESPALTHVISLSGGTLFIKDGSSLAEVITPPGIAIASLIFRSVTAGTTSRAVKVEIAFRASSSKTVITHNLYGTAVLRNSYD